MTTTTVLHAGPAGRARELSSLGGSAFEVAGRPAAFFVDLATGMAATDAAAPFVTVGRGLGATDSRVVSLATRQTLAALESPLAAPHPRADPQ